MYLLHVTVKRKGSIKLNSEYKIEGEFSDSYDETEFS